MFNFTKSNKKRIFLDYASTTPISKSVLNAMFPFFSDKFQNPSSIHKEGVEVKKAIEMAREDVAKVLSVKSSDIYFTNGGTESINLAIFGVVRSYLNNKDFSNNLGKPHLIIGKTEHPAVIESAKFLEKEGVDVTYLDVKQGDGIIDSETIINALTKNTVLISIMYANSEIGVISPIGKISRAIREWKKENNVDLESFPFIHTDASQAPNYLSVQVEKLGVDLMTLDGSKIYGPKSSGILFKKSFIPIHPILFGGSQENGLRAGTENVSAIVGFSKALSLAQDKKERELESERVIKLRDYFIDQILERFSKIGVSLNGSRENRLPNNVNICFPNQNAEFLVLKLDTKGVAVASTTACKSLDDASYSYVIEALGEDKKDCADSSIRFTFGRKTTKKELDLTIKILENLLL